MSSKLGFALGTGIAGGLMGLEKYRNAETEYNRKTKFEQLQQQGRKELEAMREAYSRDIADQRMAFGEIQSQRSRDTQLEVADKYAEMNRQPKQTKLSQYHIDSAFDQVAPSIKMMFPDAFGIGGETGGFEDDGNKASQYKTPRDYMEALAPIMKDPTNPRHREAQLTYMWLQNFLGMKTEPNITPSALQSWVQGFGMMLQDQTTKGRQEFDYADQGIDTSNWKIEQVD